MKKFLMILSLCLLALLFISCETPVEVYVGDDPAYYNQRYWNSWRWNRPYYYDPYYAPRPPRKPVYRYDPPPKKPKAHKPPKPHRDDRGSHKVRR